ncbi:MAG: S8 family serine peptidase [Synergistaceae bacterium]|nr:S8 family serine peptidase [Synergistaceae bacterium]
MKKRIIIAILAIFVGTTPLFAAETVMGEFVDGEALVVLEAPVLSASKVALFNEAVTSSAESVAASVGAQALQTYGAIAMRSGKNIVHIRSEHKTTEELIAELETISGVISAWPNYISRASLVPSDPKFNKQWGLRYINAAEAWDITTGEAGIFVAVIDSGIDYMHEDLAGNIGRDLDGNLGFDAVNKDADPIDDHGHGTHVAGIIGAVGNNGIGVTGVNWKVSLLAVKVLDSEIRGNDAGIIAGLNYVLEQKERGLNIRVANMSLTGWREPILDQEKNPYGAACKALSDAGVILVVAAGNEKQNLDSPDEYYDWSNFRWVDLRGKRPYPACFTFENMITVGSMAGDRAPSSFTNFSPNFVHLAAPGTDIPSTWPGNEYKVIEGTSMATPHVTGTAALIAARFPRKSAPEIKARIVANTIRNYFWEGRVVYGGYLDTAAALGEPEPTVPVTAISLFPDTLKFSGKTSLPVTATVRPVYADKKDIIWCSDNPAVAVVSKTDTGATITSVSDGKATIKAHALDGGASASVSVTVTGAGAAVMGGGGGCSVAAPLAWTSLLLFVPFLFLRR